MQTDELKQAVALLQSRLTPAVAEAQVRVLLRQGQDVGGGVNAFRLVKSWLAGAANTDEQVMWAYAELKPKLVAALAQVPSLYLFEGD
jgi:hypothetical protein